jgi:hypothetical protein
VSTRDAIVKLLRTGVGNLAIAREVHVDRSKVAAIRAELGLPRSRRRYVAASPEALFRQRTQPVDGGHLAWTGYRNTKGVPAVRTVDGMRTAYRIAFQIRHGREPVGYVKPGCEYDGCVHPEHVEDQPMREQYAAIFGEVAA